MQGNGDALRALLERVSAFHLTDKTLLAANLDIRRTLESGDADESAARSYLAAVHRYFAGFEREARAHLRDVDKRLEHANQVVFNLTAERAVAVKRIDATQGILADTAAIEGTAGR